MVGLGQGGLVVAALRWPLVVELTLQARNLQRKEARSVGEAWAGLKAVWPIRPKLWKTQSGHAEVAEACPELARDFPEPPVRGFGIVGKIAAAEEVLKALRLDAARSIEHSGHARRAVPRAVGPGWHLRMRQADLPVFPLSVVYRAGSSRYSSRDQRAGRS